MKTIRSVVVISGHSLSASPENPTSAQFTITAMTLMNSSASCKHTQQFVTARVAKRAKDMFLQASVILSTQRRGASADPPPEGRPPEGREPGNTVNERAVCIILECILVVDCFALLFFCQADDIHSFLN